MGNSGVEYPAKGSPSREHCNIIIIPIFSPRYNRLSEPLQSRRETLEAWQLLFQFYRDLGEELNWMTDKLQNTTSKELGSSLTTTQQMVKKHQVLFSPTVVVGLFKTRPQPPYVGEQCQQCLI